VIVKTHPPPGNIANARSTDSVRRVAASHRLPKIKEATKGGLASLSFDAGAP
jgi:hypothetical protein